MEIDAGVHRPRTAKENAEHRFFGSMAVLIVASIVVGFARSYFLRPLLGAASPASQPSLTPLIHVHGALFTAWVVLLLVQARLVATQRVRAHRRLGVAGVVLAVAMVGVGTATALHAVSRGVSPAGMEPHRFLAVPLFALLVFAGLFAAAVLARRDPQTHKRLILLATIALLPPALARWLVFSLGFGPPVVLVVATAFLVPLLVWDLRTLHKLHRATLWGSVVIVVSIPVRLAVAQTGAWLATATWLVGLVR